MMMLKIFYHCILTLTICITMSTTSFAAELLTFDNAEDKQRYNRLIDELRCLVCQNQSLAESDAELAKDLRHKVYNMIQQGDSDADIATYMVERYGDFVLYSPPIKSTTLILWFGPFILLSLGGFALVIFLTRRNEKQADTLSDAEKQRIAKLLDETD